MHARSVSRSIDETILAVDNLSVKGTFGPQMRDPGQGQRSLESGTMRATVRMTVIGVVLGTSPSAELRRLSRESADARRRLERETVTVGSDPPTDANEHFKPTGTIFVLTVFVATLFLLWGSVYVILLARGVTVQ